MSVRNWPSKWCQSPRGMWTINVQRRNGNPERASSAQNCRLSPGVMGTRPGTTAVFSTTGAVAGMFNWVTPGGVSLVLYKDGDTVKCFNETTLAITTLLSGLNGAVNVVFADLDVWVYFCGYDANDNGTFQARIFDGVNVDIAFRGPVILSAASATDTGTGYCTAGTHYFGFVYQNRTGYAGVPVTSLTFAVTATTNASPDVITAPGNNLVTGNTLSIAGSTGDTAINGSFTALVVTPGSTFQVISNATGLPVAGNGAYSGGGVLTVPIQITILPGFSITATATADYSVTDTTNADPDVLTVTGHTFVNGQVVTGAGATGDTAINGTFLIANAVAGVSVELTDLFGNPIAGNGVYTGGGVLTAADLITAPGNNLNTGDDVTITGATGDPINGNFTVQVVATGSTFNLFDVNGNPIQNGGAYTGGGVVEGPIPNAQQITISVTLPAQLDGGTDANGGVQATLLLIATPTNNPANWFFIPDNPVTNQVGEQPVPYDMIATLTFVMNVSDFDINASYDSANPNFLFLSQDVNGNGPFNPNFVAVYGTRMVYGTGTVAYASELDDPQQIAADLNQIILPNQRQISMGLQLPNSSSFYLTGDRWTAYVTDNGDEPSTWAVPTSVSNALGAPFPHCVCFTTGSNNAWIATAPGLYYFDGTYADHPVTFMISNIWDGLNWNAAPLIEMADDIDNLRFYCTIPNNQSLPNVPSQILVFDYQNGKAHSQIDITYDVFTEVAALQAVGSVAVIRELTGKTNVWVGPPSAGSVVRYDSTVYTDQGSAIGSYWISGLFLGNAEMTSAMLRLGFADIWLHGSGAASLIWAGPDYTQTVGSLLQTTAGVNVEMSPNPGLTYQTKFDFSQIENFTFAMGAGTLAGDWFSLSGVRAYYKPNLYNR